MINERGIAMIKSFEGLRLEAYRDTLAKPPVWTVGYGHTLLAVEGMRISENTADQLLRSDVQAAVDAVGKLCMVAPNENQLAAMVSLTFNIGEGAFARSSVLRLHNSGRFAEAATAFGLWNKAGGKVRAGLTRRRAAEAALYLLPVADEQQTTRAVPDVRDPSARPPVAAMAAGAGAVLTAAQQVVAQVSSVWDGLASFGVSPHVLLAVLGTAALVAIVWFAVDTHRRNRDGAE